MTWGQLKVETKADAAYEILGNIFLSIGIEESLAKALSPTLCGHFLECGLILGP